MRKNLQKTKFQAPNTSKGITLIALVITIIVLLIFAGVAINMAIDSDGLFGKANEASEKWNTAVIEEKEELNDLLVKLDEITPASNSMITKWNIAAGDEVKIFIHDIIDAEFDLDATIDWGDGTIETKSNWHIDGGRYLAKHTYSTANAETKITITGKCSEILIRNNEKLTSIENWGNTETSYYSFSDCTNLKTIAKPQAKTFEKVISFSNAFYNCKSLERIPETMFDNCVNAESFFTTFGNCTSIIEIPEGLFDNCPNVTSFECTFIGCTSITEIPEELFDNCPNVTSFECTFAGCTSITTIPQGLFDNCTNVTTFAGAFSECTSLTGNAIPLWERWPEGTDDYYIENYQGTIERPCGRNCYSNCTGLSDYEDIPLYWKQ